MTVEETLADYLAFRRRIDAGDEADWSKLAEFFTDDAVYIDPAWGRVEGIDNITEFFSESMAGLEGWTFPVEYTAIDGDNVAIKWSQRLPGAREDGSFYEQSGYSTLVYAGDGKFSYEEDLLNMRHVLEDITESRWTPGPGFNMPPSRPDRRFHRNP